MLVPLMVLSGVGLVMATLLAFGRKAFAVEVDARQERILEILPGANCGGCGFPGCSGYASALVQGKAAPNLCPPGGAELATEIGRIMGVAVELAEPMVALVACGGGDAESPARVSYLGVADCDAAHAVAGGFKSCAYGCLGLGTCAAACPFDAISRTGTGLVVVDPERCTGCGKCVASCPRKIIRMVPRKARVHVLCVNPDKAKGVKAVCTVGCTGCKLCTKQSARLEVKGALAAVNHERDEEIPEAAALACTQGTILDERRYGAVGWLTSAAARADFEARAAAWKESSKAKKGSKKAADDGKEAQA